jgi:hypothetical protein
MREVDFETERRPARGGRLAVGRARQRVDRAESRERFPAANKELSQ